MSKTEETSASSNITLLNTRGSYVKLVTPEPVKNEPNGKKRYGATILVSKEDTAAKKKLDDAIAAIKKAHPKVKWFPSNIFLKDGDTDEKTKPEYAGHWFFAANRNEDQGAPDCYGKKKSNGVLEPEEVKKLFYSGCRMNVVIGMYKPKGWDKICASLEIAQFAGDAERFGDGSNASPDDLPDIDEEDEEIEEGEDELPEGLR